MPLPSARRVTPTPFDCCRCSPAREWAPAAPARCPPADADRPAPVLPTAELTDAALVPRSVRLYLVSFLIVGMAMSVLGPALTDLREKSGADIGDIGILFVGQSAGYIIGSFAGGRMLDRFNSHRV